MQFIAVQLNKFKFKKIFRRVLIANDTKPIWSYRNTSSDFGYYLISTTSGFLNYNHFKICERVIRKSLNRSVRGKRRNVLKLGKLHFNVLNFPVCKKSIGVRMGKGKGGIDHWVLPIKKGRVLFSFKRGVNYGLVASIETRLRYKLPIRVKLIKRVVALRDVINFN